MKRTGIAGLTGLMAAGLLLGVLALSSTAQAGERGLICPDPVDAANSVIDTIPRIIPDGEKRTERRCRVQCGRIHRVCRAMANAAHACNRLLASGIASADGVGCDLSEDPRACRDDIRDDRKSDRENNNDNKKSAREVCQDFLSECRADCESALEL